MAKQKARAIYSDLTRMSSPSPGPISDPEAGRLDSWKQIAAYLDKSERTVRRWQQTEGLPVHKHQHQAKGSVWAYQSEIDQWLAARRVSPEPLVEVAEPAPRPQARPWLLLGGGTLAAVALGAIWWLGWTSSLAPVTVAEPEPLTSLPGSAYAPALSPDGRQVAFYWQTDAATGGIYVKTIGSERVTPIAIAKPNEEYLYSPSWSPDGKTIAYLQRAFPGSRFAEHNTQSETWLCLVNATGGPSQRLIRLAERVLFYGNHRHLGWSADSQRVLAPMADGARRGIHWIPVSGGEPRQVTHGFGAFKMVMNVVCFCHVKGLDIGCED